MNGLIEDRMGKLMVKLNKPSASERHISYNNRLLSIDGIFSAHEIIDLAELLQLIAIEMKEEYGHFLGTEVES